MHSIKGKVKPEIMKQLRAERIDKVALKNLFSEQKPMLYRNMEKVFDAFNAFHAGLTSEQREKLVELFEKHHERVNRFHHG